MAFAHRLHNVTGTRRATKQPPLRHFIEIYTSHCRHCWPPNRLKCKIHQSISTQKQCKHHFASKKIKYETKTAKCNLEKKQTTNSNHFSTFTFDKTNNNNWFLLVYSFFMFGGFAVSPFRRSVSKWNRQNMNLFDSNEWLAGWSTRCISSKLILLRFSVVAPFVLLVFSLRLTIECKSEMNRLWQAHVVAIEQTNRLPPSALQLAMHNFRHLISSNYEF